MTPRIFAILVPCAVAFLLVTSAELPPVVASHFDGSGQADGFMPQRVYLAFMLALMVGLPVLLIALTSWSLGASSARINIPNKDYWLAPERRAETVAWLRKGLLWFGAFLLVFLGYMHWVVVLANRQQPPKLDDAWFFGGLAAFLAVVAAWLALVLGRFRRTA